MNKLLYLFLMIFFSVSAFNQNIVFKDATFKEALINDGVDANADGEISESEALAITSIDITNEFVKNISGLEKFTNLTTFICKYNSISSLNTLANKKLIFIDCSFNNLSFINVSGNTLLETLECEGSEITNLNLTANTLLSSLNCSNNQLANLNLDMNINLMQVYCGNNILTDINLIKNTKLEVFACCKNSIEHLNLTYNTNLLELYCYSNNLLHLDISANKKLTKLNATQNNMSTICVWDIYYAQSNQDFVKDDQDTWSIVCEALNIASIKKPILIELYPIPTTNNITVTIKQSAKAKILDSSGRVIINGLELYKNKNILNFNLKPQVYFIIIENENYKSVNKFIVH